MDIVANQFLYLELIIPELQDYLLSESLYYPLVSSGMFNIKNKPILTIGNVYYSLHILKLEGLSGQELQKKDTYHKNIDIVRSKWEINWQKKVEEEYNSRLRLWRNFMLDLDEDIKSSREEYRSQVRHRVLMELLILNDLKGIPDLQDELFILDDKYHSFTRSSAFIWDLNIRSVFPKSDYPFLYRMPL